MKPSDAAIQASTQTAAAVAAVHGSAGFTAKASKWVRCHFQELEVELLADDATATMDQLLSRIRRRAAKIIVPGSDGLITEAHVMALHTHLEEVGKRVKRGGCALC